MSFSRRQFLIAAGMAPLAFARFADAKEASTFSPTFPIVDTHCHIMTTGDVPAHGMARHYGKKVPTWILDFAVWVLLLDRSSPGVARVRSILDSDELRLSQQEAKSVWEAYTRENPSNRETSFDIGEIKKAIKWIKLMGRPQYRIVEDMIEDYPQVQLFTPAMVDLDGWGAGAAKYCVRHQIARLERIMKERRFLPTSREYYPGGAPADVRRVAVHPLVSFNPLKVNLGEEYFELIKDAVMNRGFVGVKIYPAAGFFPHINKNAAIEKVVSPAIAAENSNLGNLVDGALARLYKFCSDEGVPMMAHCDWNSATPPDGHPGYGHPKWWRQVLSNRDYKDLKVNLAHFGGDWGKKRPIEETWTHDVAELMEDFPGRVFGDLGYQTWVTEDGHWYAKAIRDILAKFPKAVDGIMYGSDWHMLYKEKNHRAFFGHTQRAMGDVLDCPAKLDNFFRYNAQRYLGLHDESHKGYLRLLAFYRREIRERSPSWLGEHSPLGWFSHGMPGYETPNKPLSAACFGVGGDACQRQLDRH